ncbi:MAG: tRNA pseudouridine13 synthase [Planctomycetota bacterium]|jgi:tRNA pseudouridine13 synthase
MSAQGFPYGPATITGRIKSQPEDFRVVEELGFLPEGQGEHLFLYIEKSGLTTPDLIDLIAADFGISSRQISQSGLKDKVAVTCQWLSLHLPGGQKDFEFPAIGNYRILDHGWHSKKLRPGTHKSNLFEIVIREVEGVSAVSLQQISDIQQKGFANYFGEQRFGQKQDNVEQALRQLSKPRLSRHRKSIYISSLRSFLFNEVLSQRIQAGLWLEPQAGDVFMLAGTRSIFSDAIDTELVQRFDSLDISATGSLYGSGDSRLEGVALEIESEVFARYPQIISRLEQQGAKSQMRSLRVIAQDLQVDFDEPLKQLSLKVSLPRGSYLTTLLQHFINFDRN